MSERYYVVRGTEARPILYGPFASEKDALRANYFSKSVEQRDKVGMGDRAFTSREYWGTWQTHFKSGVAVYDDEELKTIQTYPEDFNYKSVTIRGPRVRMHDSWKAFDASFRNDLFEKDYEQLKWRPFW